MIEESNRCNAREDTGGRAVQQVVNHSIAGGGPGSSSTHSLRQEHCKTGKEPQGNHQRPSVWKGTCHLHDSSTKQTCDSPTTDPEEDQGYRIR
jgi:hypothetical protein